LRQNNVFLTPCKSVDETLEKEFQKGEGAAMLLIGKFPEIQIDTLQSMIEDQTSENENGSEPA